MTAEFEIDPAFTVCSRNANLTVTTNPDAPDCIMIYTPSQNDKDWYGDIRLCIDTECAKALARAINLQVEMIEKLEDVE